MKDVFEKRLQATLQQLEDRHLRRSVRPLSSSPPVSATSRGGEAPEAPPGDGGRIWAGDRPLLNFSANDYLGLARHPELIRRSVLYTQQYGAGATASRLVCGTLELHQGIEARLAALKSTEAALLFNSGFQANQSVLAALLSGPLAGRSPQVFADRLCHASMYEGFRTAGDVPLYRFRHNDLNHLEQLLLAHPARDDSLRLLVVESVYSMDGDRADLPALCDLAGRHHLILYVDEAHATGVLGPDGRGLTAEVAGRVDIVMGTFGKALGSFGAYVAGSRALCDYLLNRCGGFVYTTALPPPVLGAMEAALDLLPSLQAERERVAAHGQRLRAGLRAAGGDCGQSSTQIVPLVLGREDLTLAAARALEAEGVLAVAIRPPTVPPGASRLRLALSAAHSDEDISCLLAALERLIPGNTGRGGRNHERG